MKLLFIDHRADDVARGVDIPRTRLLDLGVTAHHVPRLLLLCRALGHRPVVDGLTPPTPRTPTEDDCPLWVCCSRCGLRPYPQGRLNPTLWTIGAPYDGPGAAKRTRRTDDVEPVRPERVLDHTSPEFAARVPRFAPPGPFPQDNTGDIGGQLIVGRGMGGLGVSVKVGGAGSGHVLAASAHFGPLGEVYVNTDTFGRWIQRLLVPTGTSSKVISLNLEHGRLWWRLWSARDNPDREPAWRSGHVNVSILDWLFGPKLWSYEPVARGTAERTVRMEEGGYRVHLVLQEARHGRRFGRGRRSWSVSWQSHPGIPTRGERGAHWRDRVCGSAVTVRTKSVVRGTWPAEAAAQIAVEIARRRTEKGWQPADEDPVQVAA